MTAFDNFIAECEGLALPIWNALAALPGAAVYRVKATGEEITLPARSIIETQTSYPVSIDPSGVAVLAAFVDLDITAAHLVDAAGRRVKPVRGDQVIRDWQGRRDACTVVSPLGLQCYEDVGDGYVRVHCERVRTDAPPSTPAPARIAWVRDPDGTVRPWTGPGAPPKHRRVGWAEGEAGDLQPRPVPRRRRP